MGNYFSKICCCNCDCCDCWDCLFSKKEKAEESQKNENIIERSNEPKYSIPTQSDEKNSSNTFNNKNNDINLYHIKKRESLIDHEDKIAIELVNIDDKNTEKNNFDETSKLLDEKEDKLNNEKQNLEQKKVEFNSREEKIKNDEKNLKEKKEEQDQREQDLISKEEKIKNDEKNIKETKEELDKKKVEQDQREEDLNNKEEKIKIDEKNINEKSEELDKKKVEQDQREEDLDKREENLNKKNQDLINQEQELQKKDEEFTINCRNQEASLKQKNKEIIEKENSLKDKENSLKEKEDNLKEKQEELNEKESELIENQNKHSEEKKMQEKRLHQKEESLKEYESSLKEQKYYLNQEKKDFENDKAKFERSKLPTEIGLRNIGATCYMNATLQALSHTEQLTSFFLTKYNLNPNDQSKKMSNEMYKVILNLWDENKKRGDYPPTDFKNVLSEENPLFAGVQANDSKDLINFLLERFHKELNIQNPAPNDNNQMVNQLDEMQTLTAFINDYFQNNKSIITDCFYGILETKSKCAGCQYTKFNFQIYSFLEFPLQEVNLYMYQMGRRFNYINQDGTNPDIDLYECFDYYQKIEMMNGQNQMYCNICNGNRDTFYGTVVYSLPNYLIINLNRGKGAVYECKVNFPEILNLLNYVTFKEKTVLQLYAVISHYGPSSMSGHFIAYCRHRINKKWYKYNDSIVTECTKPQEYYDGMPYILFYKAL